MGDLSIQVIFTVGMEFWALEAEGQLVGKPQPVSRSEHAFSNVERWCRSAKWRGARCGRGKVGLFQMSLFPTLQVELHFASRISVSVVT